MLDTDIEGQTLIISKEYKKSKVCEFRDLFFNNLKGKGLILECIGIKINGQGSNNPLLVPQGCITPTYKVLYTLSNMYFELKDKEGYEYLLDELIPATIEESSGILTIEVIKKQLDEIGILMTSKSLDNLFLKSILNTTKLELIFKLVHSDYSMDECKYLHKLENYFLNLTSKVITYNTDFSAEDYQFKFSPSIVNFEEIYEETISKYQET